MKKILSLLLFLMMLIGHAQNDQLAQNYFDKGEYEKALIAFENILNQNPSNNNIFLKMIQCYQQLSNYDEADKKLTERYKKYKSHNLLVEIGYNFKLQKNDSEAIKNYNLAIESIEKNPSFASMIAQAFEKKGLYEYALSSYEKAQNIDARNNFNYQIGILYGQLGKTDLMIEKFLDESYRNQGMMNIIQNQFLRFMIDNPTENFTNALRKALIVRSQKDQDLFWNSYLSWFFINQKEYLKAFTQEKAIYKRNPESFHNIVNLAELAIEDQDTESAEEIIAFVLENTSDNSLQIFCSNFLLQNNIKKNNVSEFPKILSELELLIKKYGSTPESIPLHQTMARFQTFQLNKPENGITTLQNILKLPITEFEKADLKMDLADIYLFQEKFNQALLQYTQIEENLKNNAIAHEASLKSAKTSYFKGDFDWALNQFKVLKSATTQLIANDALEYYLLINDNKVSDSTLVALKEFAKADYLLYQNRNQAAKEIFLNILKDHPENQIVDATLYRLGSISEKLENQLEAIKYYEKITNEFPDSIYLDEALFFSAEIYLKKLNDKEKAKVLYEKIIFNHQDSIYYIEAQKKYRQIRGDFDS